MGTSPLLLCAHTRKKSRPLIGIMARPREVDGILQGKQGPVLLKYLQIARRESAYAFVFNPSAVDTLFHRIDGYVLGEANRDGTPLVEMENLPVPCVIYDQILSRRFEQSQAVQEVRQYLKMHAQIFNDGYFNKWEVHEWLSTHPRLQAHLPQTALLTQVHDLRRVVMQHETVFVKPIHGSLGVGIVKISKAGRGWYAQLRTKRGNAEEIRVDRISDLFAKYRNRWLRSPHIVQQGLRLMEIAERPMDVRVIVQKDRKGKWKVTKMYARIAAKGEFISNLTTGGEAMPLSVLPLLEPRIRLETLKRDIRKLLEVIPRVVEEQSLRTLGELGIDLGLDTNGDLFIIEVNSKPWKTPQTVVGSIELVELSFVRPIRFALQLASTFDARKETLL